MQTTIYDVPLTADQPLHEGGHRATTIDRWRSACLIASTAAMIGIPLLGPALTGSEEGAEEYDTDITPPDFAFAIWGPIFGIVAASTYRQGTHPTDPVSRRTGWYLTAAYATNAAWSLLAQGGRFRATPYVLPLAAGLAGVAHHVAQPLDPDGRWPSTSGTAGALFGWTSVASVVNAFATGPGRDQANDILQSHRALAAAATVVNVLILRSRHGFLELGASATWAFLTNATNNQRTVRGRQVNAVAAGATVAATAVRWAVRRRG